nr:hypothetical protein CFP56_47160 [Quercus suber]
MGLEESLQGRKGGVDIWVRGGLDVDRAWELRGAFGDEGEFEKFYFFFFVERSRGRGSVVLGLRLWLWLWLREVAKEEGGGFGVVCAAERGGDGGVWAVVEEESVGVLVEWT